jgi:hypothetical protein
MFCYTIHGDQTSREIAMICGKVYQEDELVRVFIAEPGEDRK